MLTEASEQVATTADDSRKSLEHAGGFRLAHRILLTIDAKSAAPRMIRPLCSSLANFMVQLCYKDVAAFNVLFALGER